MQYEEKTFNLPTLAGLSEKQLEEHLKLYAGYVKHVNLVRQKIHELEMDDPAGNSYLISELRRRFSFEFNGMRMHEYYFEALENGPAEASEDSPLVQALSEKYSSFDAWLEHFKTVGMTRGIGWTVLYYDPIGKTPHTVWVGDHELGVLAGLPIILAMDMWEHAFMIDYIPGEKKDYIEAFFKNLNWQVMEDRFNHMR